MTRRSGAALLVLIWLGGSITARQSAGDDVTMHARRLVDALTRQEFGQVLADFTPQMKAAIPEDRLRATWQGLIAQLGPFKQLAAVRLETRGVMRVAVATCEFEGAAIDMQIAFNPAGLVGGWAIVPASASYSPPPYSDGSKYTEVDVSVGAPGWSLPGTLTVPLGPGPFAAVVLVHGSGPHDRDSSIGPNKIFRDLALGLGSKGIAVLRYEKRSKVYGDKLAAVRRSTVKDEVIDDVLSAVDFLRQAPRIDPRRIVVLGHSLGGTLIPRIGAVDPKIGGLISMAGATRPLAQAMLDQAKYLASADGNVTPDEQEAVTAMEDLGQTVAALKPADADDPKRIQGAPASYWLDLRGYDPAAAARTLTQPLLVVQGERDYQVTMADDFARWKAALEGAPRVTFRTYPALNHLFLPGIGKSVPGEYFTAGHVAPEVINDLAAWIETLK